jgi:hypothetical protein
MSKASRPGHSQIKKSAGTNFRPGERVAGLARQYICIPRKLENFLPEMPHDFTGDLADLIL